MRERLNENQAVCLENAAWYIDRAASAHSDLRQYLLEMAACWEGLARNFREEASQSGTFATTAMGAGSSTSSACIELATEAEDAARRTHDVSLQESLHRLADAWRRLGAACKLAENVERKSAK